MGEQFRRGVVQLHIVCFGVLERILFDEILHVQQPAILLKVVKVDDVACFESVDLRRNLVMDECVRCNVACPLVRVVALAGKPPDVDGVVDLVTDDLRVLRRDHIQLRDNAVGEPEVCVGRL